ncbi:MAG: hypothetical protein AB3N64_06255 [Puniceicoccaceae bacterium]
MKRLGAICLTLWVLVLQFAGSSPHLHAFLHGDAETRQTCAGHGPSDDPCSGESESPEPSNACTVILLADGIITAEGLDFRPVSGELLAVLDRILPVSPEEEFLLLNSARAPPVL